MPVKYKYRQISLKDAFSDCQDMFVDDAPSFFQLLNEHFDIQEFIPSVFRNAFYQHFGRKRDYPLEGFLSALILQKIFSIPSDSLLLLFLSLSRELRDFCGFSKVPDASLLTRFKQNFEPYIELMFEQMVDYTEPICQLIDSQLAQILTFDTSGIELYVNENNPKTLNALIRNLKTFYKDKPDVDPYAMAYGLMPSHAALCLPMPPPAPTPNSSTSTATSAMPISLPSLPTGLVLYATLPLLMMATLKRIILNWPSKRRQIPRMKINRSVTLPHSSLSFPTSFPFIPAFIRTLSSAIPPLTPLSFMAP